MAGESLHVLGVIGSARSDSTTASVIRAVLDEAGRRGSAVRCLDLRAVPLPLFDPETAAKEPPVAHARELIVWADALVLGTPDYHGGPSGILKNFLDHFWKELGGKLVGVVVASNEKGLTVQDHLRTSLRQCYAWSLPYGVGASDQALGPAGEVRDERILQRLRMMARDLVSYGPLLRDQRRADLAAGDDPLEVGFMAKMHIE